MEQRKGWYRMDEVQAMLYLKYIDKGIDIPIIKRTNNSSMKQGLNYRIGSLYYSSLGDIVESRSLKEYVEDAVTKVRNNPEFIDVILKFNKKRKEVREMAKNEDIWTEEEKELAHVVARRVEVSKDTFNKVMENYRKANNQYKHRISYGIQVHYYKSKNKAFQIGYATFNYGIEKYMVHPEILKRYKDI